MVDRPIVPLEIPEWKGRIFVRGVSATEMDAQLASYNGNGHDYNVRFAAMVACDGRGERLFKTPEQVKMLGSKLYSAVKRIVEAGEQVNGMWHEDAKKNSRQENAPVSGLT